MLFEDITPLVSKEKRKTKRMYYNPETGRYVNYAQAMNLKKKGIDLFHNNVEVQSEDIAPVLEEKLRCTNILIGAIDKIINDTQ